MKKKALTAFASSLLVIMLLVSCDIKGESGTSEENQYSVLDSSVILSETSVAESVIVSGIEWADSSAMQFSDVSTTDYTSPEQLIAYEFLEKVEVFNNITMGNLPYAEITNPSPDLAEYYIVNDNRFKSFSDIQEFFYTIYKKEKADYCFELITTD